MHVEDDPSIQMVTKVALQSIGKLQVHTCSGGQEALDAVLSVNPDLILLDVMMPGMDGPTTLQQLKGLIDITKTPVVFLTAKVQPQEIQRYRELGAIGVIIKPFDPMQLASQVKALWTEHQQA
jgi:CheY-like chemotaxis protein